VGLVVVVPITSRGGKVCSFALPIQSRQVSGVAVLSDLRSLDYTTRKIAFANHAPKAVAIEANKRISLILPTA
jgi:mRNA-degrading endonuclease toxin of MazEF toxin-antitoxin module